MQIRKFSIWPWFLPLAILLLLFRALAPQEGVVGHDYYHAIPRLLMGRDFFWKNPLSLPYYFAGLCGGIPYLADPQSYYFSLPQWLAFIMDPFAAALMSIGIFYLFGYLGAFRLARQLGFTASAAHLGAVLFSTNGFLFENLFVGHLTHHAFALTPWLVAPFLRKSSWKDGAIPGLILTYTFLSGGLHVLAVWGALALLLAPLVLRRELLRPLAGTLGVFLLGTSGKWYLASLYSPHFHTGTIHRSAENPFSLFLQYFWFNPLTTPLSLPFGELLMGIWEYVGFVSKLTLPLSLYALFRFRQRRALLLLGLAGLVVFFLGAGIGNAHLPLIRRYHNPVKLWAAFIPLFCFASAWALNQIRPKALVLGLVFACVLAEFALYTGYFRYAKIGLGFRQETIPMQKLPPIRSVNKIPGADLQGLFKGSTSLACYEPVFGYRQEAFHSQLEPGLVHGVKEGAFNLNHPGCFLWPEFFQCQGWDRIAEKDGAEVEAFTAGQAAFSPPLATRIWMGMNLIFLVFVAVAASLRFRNKAPK